jgi:hypothetical protein
MSSLVITQGQELLVWVELQLPKIYLSQMFCLLSLLVFNLLSIAQLCDLGLICTFDKYSVIVFHEKDKSLMFKGFRYEHFYIIHYSFHDA